MPTNRPRFAAPDFHAILTQRIAEDAVNVRVEMALAKNPTGKWLESQKEGIQSAQRLINDYMDGLDLTPFLAEAAHDQAGEQRLALARRRLRVKEDAGIADILTAIIAGQFSRDSVMLCAMNRPISPYLHWTKIATLKRQPWMGYDQETNETIVRARNILAHRFLASGAQWAFWVDDDTIPPFADPGAFYLKLGAKQTYIKPEFLQFHAFDRMSSRGKTVIGGIVPDRHGNNQLIIQPAMKPKNDSDRKFVEKLVAGGPRNDVHQVDWAGCGCLLVHRSAFTDVMKKFPERQIENGPFNFFGGDTVGVTDGEDTAFTKLCGEAGHPSWLDLSVWCAHTGVANYFAQAPK